MTCDACDYHYYLAINEEGWRCTICDHKPGEPPGFSPQLDREELGRKVYGVLWELTTINIMHVSNGTHGDSIVAGVAATCRERGLYDQESIALFILEGSQPSHAKYWKKVSDGIMAGRDPRHRCPCGALATCTTMTTPPTRRCGPHFGIKADSDVPGYQAQLFPEVPRCD